MNKDEVSRLKRHYAFEKNAAFLYDSLASLEADSHLSEIFRRLAAAEGRHAAEWADRLTAAGRPVPVFRPSFKASILAGLARRIGPQAVLTSLSAMESEGARDFARGEGEAGAARDGAVHGKVLRMIGQQAGGMPGGQLALLEGRHRGAGGNALRAAVLGANDGLVSVLSLVMGVAGAGMSTANILVAGIAGTLAGAISMALGEWLSVQSSRELYGRQIEIEKAEIESNPEDEIEELSLIYQARGLEADTARDMAEKIMADPEKAIDVLAREELAIDPEELGGSALEAALTSFALFSVGAAIPVLPFALMTGAAAITASIGAAILGLFGIGAATSLFTGRSFLSSGLRMVLIGLAAAGVTFGIGRLIGMNLGG